MSRQAGVDSQVDNGAGGEAITPAASPKKLKLPQRLVFRQDLLGKERETQNVWLYLQAVGSTATVNRGLNMDEILCRIDFEAFAQPELEPESGTLPPLPANKSPPPQGLSLDTTKSEPTSVSN
ncbi:hypothetical protein AAF712_016550 [Marasmius tenuissimus]|uniref:Uncharacterized protein n=1 Tax=Marasmius tenuissimus TaxID=585030 RepID=A0ABR2Z5G7_9AGAR